MMVVDITRSGDHLAHHAFHTLLEECLTGPDRNVANYKGLDVDAFQQYGAFTVVMDDAGRPLAFSGIAQFYGFVLIERALQRLYIAKSQRARGLSRRYHAPGGVPVEGAGMITGAMLDVQIASAKSHGIKGIVVTTEFPSRRRFLEEALVNNRNFERGERWMLHPEMLLIGDDQTVPTAWQNVAFLPLDPSWNVDNVLELSKSGVLRAMSVEQWRETWDEPRHVRAPAAE